jgi:hypothetical protein
MNQVARRIIGATGALVIGLFCLGEIWLFFRFTRVYFPEASMPVVRLAVGAILFIYFFAIAISGRWVPWKRNNS